MRPFSVVIPSRLIGNLDLCLQALEEKDPGQHIIVVDDGLDWNRKVHDVPPDVIVPGIKPFVYARNVNLGIQAAPSGNDIVLLNDDALLMSTEGLRFMARQGATTKGYGIIGAVSNSTGNIRQLGGPGGDYYLRDEPRMVCFICVWISRCVINSIGLLDEEFTGYGFEDDDYCLRARQSGFRIGISVGCYVDHRAMRSTFRTNGPVSLEVNRLKFIAKHGGHPKRRSPGQAAPRPRHKRTQTPKGRQFSRPPWYLPADLWGSLFPILSDGHENDSEQ